MCRRVIADDKDVEVDHIERVSDGCDPFDESNLRLTHRGCNRRRRRTPQRPGRDLPLYLLDR